MFRAHLSLLFAFAMASATLHAGDALRAHGVPKAPPAPMRYLAGTVIVKLKPAVLNRRGTVGFGVPAIDAVLRPTGLSGRRSLFPLAPYPETSVFGISGTDPLMRGFDRTYVVNYTGPFDPRSVADELVATDLVEFAEPYYVFNLCYTPNDPLLAQQTWLNQIQARGAWDVTKGDSSIAIGVVDTGLDWAHEDLAPNAFLNPGESGTDAQGKDKRTNNKDDDGNGMVDDYHGWDFVGNVQSGTALQNGQFQPDNDPSPRPNSDVGYEGFHGTNVGGCASARTDNAKGVAGVGFLSRLIGIKCTADSLGTNSVITGYDGIRYAADVGARVINCSWGGPIDGGVSALQQVVNYAFQKGSLVVAAGGNSGTNNDLLPSYPANLNHVLSVGATTGQDSAAGFSQYGVTVDVWAPGTAIYTTIPGDNYGASVNGNPISGTSFAAPITSGIAALVFAKHPDWTPDQVAMQLHVTGDLVKVPAALAPYFHRRANAQRAVSQNATLNAGDPTGIPGIGIVGYTINGRTTDTIRSTTQTVSVQLTLENYLSPASDVKVEAVPGQSLTTAAPLTIPSIGTLKTSTHELQVGINPNGGTIYSEGVLQLVLRVTSGSYNDYLAVQIPVRLPGWHLQVDPVATNGIPVFTGSGMQAVSPKAAWTTANYALSQTTQRAYYARTLDGDRWSQFSQVPPGNEALYCITALDERRAWAGSGPSSGQAAVFKTTNGGAAWQRVSVAAITPFVDAVHFFDDQNGIFLGDPLGGNWGIGITTDAGATWSPLAQKLRAGTSAEAGWNNSFAVYGDNVWFGTNNSRIYRSTDRGRTWAFATTPSVNAFSISFGTASDGIASFAPQSTGAGSYMLTATRDGGKAWTQMPLPFAGAQPSGVCFVPGTTRAFVATQNGMFETSDFGATWTLMPVPPVAFQTVTISTSIDNDGHIGAYSTNVYAQLSTYKDTAESESAVPAADGASDAVLMANIPNPGNGSTTIPFVLNAPARIRLVLHDVLGMELRTIAEGSFAGGRHDVSVDLTGFPSGAYYYTLIVGGTHTTRRMIVAR